MRWRYGLAAALVALSLVACASAGGSESRASGAPAAALAVPEGSSPGAPAAAPRGMEKIGFAVPQVNGVTMPYAIGYQKGFFREEGLDVEISVLRTNLVAAALTSGEVDYISSFIPAVRNALTGLPMRVIAGTATGSTRRLMSVPSIQSVEQLRGQTIAIASIGDGPHSGGMLVLDMLGIDPETEVTWLVAGNDPGDRFVMLQQGLAQASVIGGPEIAQAEALGLVTLVRLDEVAPMPESGVTTSLRKLETEREQVKRVARAVVRSLRYVKTDREGSLPGFMERLRMTREEAERAYDSVVGAFSDDGTVSERSLRFTIEAQKRQLKLTEDVVPSRVADFGPLYEALGEMGITPAGGSAR